MKKNYTSITGVIPYQMLPSVMRENTTVGEMEEMYFMQRFECMVRAIVNLH